MSFIPGDQRHIYLAHDRVFGVAYEGFDLEVLLNPLQEQLNLPTLFVDIVDRFCCQAEMIGQKDIVLNPLWISVSTSTKRMGTLSCLDPSKDNRLISG
ncbi:MAG: hypothetical protein SWH78_17710 [Thermodesulfobacteriota bacterium]|nr:hypothetical protein [Thermodesulfobacteriota bacterium]